MCDPTRIISMANEKAQNSKQPAKRGGILKRKGPAQKKKECIIYISGGSDMEFGHQFLDYSLARMIELYSSGGQAVVKDSLPCEVHIFTPSQVRCLCNTIS